MPSKNQIMNNNYHTHMYLCRHAEGDVNDYVEEAIKLKFHSLGMSDHAPFEELKDRSVRMKPSELSVYIEKCARAKKKYENQIQVYTGLEIEYFSDHIKMYPSLLEQMDYLALGQHYIHDEDSPNHLKSSYGLITLKHLRTYVDTVIEAMSTGYFKFVCHPDLFLYNIRDFSEDIEKLSRELIRASVRYNVPLEINANGIRKGLINTSNGPRYKYPREEFWLIAKELNAKVIVSSDAHKPEFLLDDVVKQTLAFASKLGIVVEEALQF